MNILETWQFNVIAYFVSVVVYFQYYKLAVMDAERDGAATLLLQTIASVAVLSLAFFIPFTFPSDWKVYLLLVGACFFYALNDRLQTTSRKHLEVSVFSLVNQLSTVFLILIGLTIFQEPIILSKMIGVGCIIFGNIILFYRRGKFQFNKHVWIGVLATFFFALAISIDIGISQQFNLPFYIMLTLTIPALIIFFIERIRISEVVREYNGRNRRYYLITGIAWALTIFFTLRAFQFGEVTTIVPLQATSIFLNVAIAYFFQGERENGWRKLIAAGLIFFGLSLTIF